MAEYFTNAFASFSGSSAWFDLYTTPEDRKTVVSSLQVANDSGSAGNSIYASARVYDYSSGSSFNLIKEAEIPVCTAMDMLTKHVTLMGGDKLQVMQSSTSGSSSFVMSGFEVS